MAFPQSDCENTSNQLGHEQENFDDHVVILTKQDYRYNFADMQSMGALFEVVNRLLSGVREGTFGAIPHLGAGIVAGELMSLGCNVQILDISDPRALAVAQAADLVGVSMLEISADHVIEDILPQLDLSKTIVGGIGATVMETELHSVFPDLAIVSGESEGLMRQILTDLHAGQLQGHYRRDKSVDMAEATHEPYLDERFSYRNLSPFRRSFLKVLEVGRGCPYGCNFCITPNLELNNSHKPMDVIKAELAAIKEQAGPKIIFFVDQNLCTYPKAYLHQLFDYINDLGLAWVGEGTVQDILEDEDLVSKMARNCASFLVGLEDISHNIRGSAAKNKLHEGILSKVTKLRKMGLPIVWSMVFGTDEQDLSVFKDTVDFVKEAGITIIPHIETPRRGTVRYRNLNKENRLIECPAGKHDQKYHVTHKPANMTPDELMGGFAWMYQQVFSERAIAQRFWQNLQIGGMKYAAGLSVLELDGWITNVRLHKMYPKLLQDARGIIESNKNRKTSLDY